MTKRVTIFLNGQQTNGKVCIVCVRWELSQEHNFQLFLSKVVLVPEEMDTLIKNASKKLSVQGDFKLFTQKGGEIDDIDLIRDDEILFLCLAGESFTNNNSAKPNNTHQEEIDMKRKRNNCKMYLYFHWCRLCTLEVVQY